ncbi:MAG: hypothetical protein WAQ33_13915 [Gaiellaceae bacterium]
MAALVGGVCAGVAFADVVPTPPISAPTLPVVVPSVPAVPPVPAVPSVPAPPLPKPPSLPSTPVSAPAAPGHVWTPPLAGIASAQSLSLGPSSSSGAGSGTSSASPGRAHGRSSIARFRSSRPWIAKQGPNGHRRTTLTFRLPSAARVVFTVTQVSPVCRAVGQFTVRGHIGLNRIPFKGRVRGRPLSAGTYRISARVRGGGTVLRVLVVIVESGSPSPTELLTAQRSNVCGARAALASNGVSGTAASSPSQGSPTNQIGQSRKNDSETGGVAGKSHTSASPFAPAEVTKQVTNPVVIAALAAAVLLLGLAAVPKAAIPDPRLTDALARHRVEVALAGGAALAAAILALLLV